MRAATLLLLLAVACAAPDAARTRDASVQLVAAALPLSDASVTFTDLDGKPQQPLAGAAKATVLIFIASDCPIANGYAPEINAIVREHAGDDLRFFLVHVDPATDRAQALEHARAYGYSCPVLLDPRHELVRRTGVTVTPEVAVLLADGTLAYRGRIDDWYAELGRKRRAPAHHDLRDALAAVLAGRPVPEPRTAVVGCFIAVLP